MPVIRNVGFYSPFIILYKINEQYKLEGKKQKNVLLRPKEEISADSVQSPHDSDLSLFECSLRNFFAEFRQ